VTGWIGHELPVGKDTLILETTDLKDLHRARPRYGFEQMK
jgi:hypothetical protein